MARGVGCGRVNPTRMTMASPTWIGSIVSQPQARLSYCNRSSAFRLAKSVYYFTVSLEIAQNFSRKRRFQHLRALNTQLRCHTFCIHGIFI